MNKWSFPFNKQKRGMVFLLDIFLGITLFVSFILLIITLVNSTPFDNTPQYQYVQSLHIGLDDSQLLHDMINSGSTTTMEYALNQTIADPYCAQVLVYTTTPAVVENVTQSGCTYSDQKLTSAFGTIVVDNTVYTTEVNVWQE